MNHYKKQLGFKAGMNKLNALLEKHPQLVKEIDQFHTEGFHALGYNVTKRVKVDGDLFWINRAEYKGEPENTLCYTVMTADEVY